MNFRKNSVLIIGCSIAAVLLAISVFFLFRNQKSYRENTSALDSAKSRLNTLNTRNPYPSPENVKLAGENLDLLKKKYEDIQTTLQSEQLNPAEIESARFAPLLEDSVHRVFSKANEAGVVISPELGLGFKDYAAGKLPPNDPAIMERLVLQVKALEDICLLMIDSKVQSIDLIQRDQFETKPTVSTAEPQVDLRGRGRIGGQEVTQETAGSGTVGGLPPPVANDLYKVERISIGVTGWESSIWEALNRLASRKIVYASVDVTLQNTLTDLGKPVDMKAKLSSLTAVSRQPAGTTAMAGSGLPQPTLESISREERIVGGREPVKAKIVVDMYRFSSEPAAGGQP